MKYLLAIFFSIFVIACSNSESSYTIETPSNDEISSIAEIEGMIHLESGFTTIGSNDKDYKTDEKPAMKVNLDYDFYMGIHEVTCGEYESIAKEADLKSFGKCKNDSLPLANITYYDAVLFANAKSKLNDHDTAYTYSSAVFDNEGHCTELEGFAFHPEANAFRLPTEAEWVYAATLDWDVKKSWSSENSGYKLHTICGKGADSSGFCDMAGNALEWVNDWKGDFRDMTVTNYVGAPSGEDLGERVVKGGCYSTSENELNPYSRGDIYTVTSSTRAEYVGFRLAFGSIPNALWMSNDGTSQTSVITLLAGNETIKKITGSYNVKLAFRNDVSGNLAYIDYLNGSMSVKEITKNSNSYHPEISPDGNWIAYCTGIEGVAGESEIYVQSLDQVSPIQVKLKVESAAIPRWRILENGDTTIVYVTDAGSNKNKATFKSTSTWQVKFMDGKFGTPQKLFDGAYHGGISEDRTLAVSGAQLLRVRVAQNGSSITEKANNVVWYDSAQACNVSLSQDGTKRTAFLDFSGKPGRKFVGENYSTHERLFIADSTGKLIQSIKAPSDYTFDHTEWTTDGEKSIIVASLTNANGAHSKIALINPEDNNIIEIVEGDELWHPNLWIKKKPSKPVSNNDTLPAEPTFELDPDSAGIYYNTSGAHDRADQWRYKMEFLWKYKDTANIVIIGSSRTYYGINPLLFSEPYFAANLSVSGNQHKASYRFLTHYVLPHVSKLKIVVKDIDLDRWHTVSSGIFGSAYTAYPGYVYDKNHNYWKDNYPDGLAEAAYDAPGSTLIQGVLRPTRGYQEKPGQGWGKPTTTHDSTWLDELRDNYYENFDYLVEMIKECQKRDIIFIGIVAPENPRYKETGAFGKHGLRRSEATSLLAEISSLSEKYPNFILMDENKMGNHDYTDEMAFDTDHLAGAGATQLTLRLDSLIKTLNINFEQ